MKDRVGEVWEYTVRQLGVTLTSSLHLVVGISMIDKDGLIVEYAQLLDLELGTLALYPSSWMKPSKSRWIGTSWRWVL